MTEYQKDLVLSYEGIVYKIARRIVRRNSPDYEDCIQEGMYGLCLAATRFKPSFGVKFLTYASTYVEGFIRRFKRENYTIRIPRSAQDNLYKIYKYNLSKSIGDRDKMLEDLGISREDYYKALSYRFLSSLEEEVYEDYKGSEPICLGDTVVDGNFRDFVSNREDMQFLYHLKDGILSKEKDHVRKIYDDYFNLCLLGYDISQRVIAERHGVSQGYVSKIISRITKKLSDKYKLCIKQGI